MKTKTLTLLAVPFLASAAIAQYAPVGPPPGAPVGGPGWDRGPGGPGGYDRGTFWRGAPDSPWQRIQFLQDRINRGVSDGSLNRREANRANRDLAGVRQWIRRMRWDGNRLTPDQRDRVQARLDQVSGQIRWARRNG